MPPAEAWMVAGGVGLAPFVTLAEALAARGTPATLFYGARTRRGAVLTSICSSGSASSSVLTTEDGSRGTQGHVTAPLETALAALRRDTRRHGSTPADRRR